MAYTTINDPTNYFTAKLWTGNGSTQNITGLNFQPDWVWLKNRDSGSQEPCSYDSVRGVQQRLFTSGASGDSSSGSGGLTAFNSDGFSLGSAGNNNGSGVAYVSWNWLGANGTASNSNGSITSTVSANTTSGFSIVSYTGNGTAGATVGHGLGSKPSVIFIKARSGSNNWCSYHTGLNATKFLRLNSTNAESTRTESFNDTEPTSSVFSLGTDGEVNSNTVPYIAYCFTPIKGYSSFGTYKGNGQSTTGLEPFIYLGFKPAWVLYKRASDGTNNWSIFDNKRDPHNEIEKQLNPNINNAEGTSGRGHFVSNGWKVGGGNSGSVNNSGTTYIFMAFAESPFVNSNGIPTNAR